MFIFNTPKKTQQIMCLKIKTQFSLRARFLFCHKCAGFHFWAHKPGHSLLSAYKIMKTTAV